MYKYILLVFILWANLATANDSIYYENDLDGYNEQARQWERTHVPTPGVHPYLWPINPNVYGPGINSDATGKPFTWSTPGGQFDPLLKPQPRSYGPGIGMDQYGRPLTPTCPYGLVC